jgi:predicted nucleic-acid-binding Zn-ribbon protein
MGMYDEINVNIPCPKCGNTKLNWQSKERGCTLDLLEPEEVTYFGTYCGNCEKSFDFERPVAKPQRRVVPLTREQIEALGFRLQT